MIFLEHFNEFTVDTTIYNSCTLNEQMSKSDMNTNVCNAQSNTDHDSVLMILHTIEFY